MPFVRHPACKQPKNLSSSVWRYMSFTKFVALLNDRSIFFTRADKFDDPFEGTQTSGSAAERAAATEVIRQKRNMPPGYSVLRNHAIRAGSIRRRSEVGISCWHIQPNESVAMWSLYAHMNEGVAVRSTYRKLRDSLIDSRPVHLGKVTYLNYRTQKFSTDNELEPFLNKRIEFEHEREVRAIVVAPGTGADASQPLNADWKPTFEAGIPIAVNLSNLIEEIYVSPKAPPWFTKLVRDVVVRFEYNFPVRHSDLGGKPIN